MIYLINIKKNNLLYGLYDTNSPYPKNSPLKKSVNKRLFHVIKTINLKTSLNYECALCSILSH